MKVKLFSSVVLLLVAVFAGCKKDNFKAPSSSITGKVVYQGQAVGLRSNGVQLEVWQHGYQLFSKIPVYLAQDGTFTVALFDGDYKVTLLKGNGPWADKPDSIDVHVSGTAAIDVPVNPYYLVKTSSFTKNGTAISGIANLQGVTTSKSIEAVRMYISSTTIVDQTNNIAKSEVAGSTITDITQPVNLSVSIPSSLASNNYVFVRIGVKTTGVTELAYGPVQKVNLK